MFPILRSPPTRGHVDGQKAPHQTLNYITRGLQAGDLLKFDGRNLAKATKGSDYVNQNKVIKVDAYLNGWMKSNTDEPGIIVKTGCIVSVVLKIKPSSTSITKSVPILTLPYRAVGTTYEIPLVGSEGEKGMLQLGSNSYNLVVYGPRNYNGFWNTANFWHMSNE